MRRPGTSTGKPQSYVPALGCRWLTRFYDPILRATLKEGKLKGLLVAQARLRPGQRVLDLGCGTATLTVMVKRACPSAVVVGLDADPDALAIGREKIAAAGVDVELREGMAFAPPFPAGSFDRIVSSLLFHHLSPDAKRRTLGAVRELLTPGGEFHVLDWGKAQNLLMRATFLGVQLLDGFPNTTDNVRGRLVPLMEEAGLVDVAETHREMTVFGTLSLYRAVRAAPR
jgi:cyclopropane fatty-acyl-phospholipid synthase-like methyltransferase